VVQPDLAAEVQHQGLEPRRRIELEADGMQFLLGRHEVGRKRRRLLHQHQRVLLLLEEPHDMNAEKSESPRLSRRNISVAGSADHSVMAFILMVRAWSSLSRLAYDLLHGTSFSMFQRRIRATGTGPGKEARP